MAPRIAALALGAVAAAASGVLLRRRGGSPLGGGGGTSPRGDDNHSHAEWQCACGQQFRASGTGRHRILWLPDAGPDDPYLEPTCPSCERELAPQD